MTYVDEGALRRARLRTNESHTVGRLLSNEIVIRHGSVSRLHAIIVGSSPPAIKDVGSRNGVRVAGARIAIGEFVPIEQNTIVQIGDVPVFVEGIGVGSESADAGALHGEASNTSPGHREAAELAADPLIAEDERTRQLLLTVRVMARSELSVVVQGETGVGKERFARMIHAVSSRSGGPLVSVNCAALPASLIETELFGHARGAFTGAVDAKVGLIAAAHGGTLFLDEVVELPLAAQAKLLRVLEAREITPIGAVKARPVDVRFVAATNRDLRAAVAAREFREDLYYRLNGATIDVPGLRDRPADIRPLARLFAARFAEGLGRAAPTIAEDAAAFLMTHKWPGNVRELKNVIERATLLATSGVIERNLLVVQGADDVRSASSLFDPITLVTRSFGESSLVSERPGDTAPTDAPMRQRILDALNRVGGNQVEAARFLGVSRRRFDTWLDAYAIPRPRKRRSTSQ